MESLSQLIYEESFVTAYLQDHEIVVPYIEADTFVDSIDLTREHVQAIIRKYGLEKIGEYETAGIGRFTEEHGHHYWLRAITKVGF